MILELNSKHSVCSLDKNKNIYCYFAGEMEPIGKMSIGSMITKICRKPSATKVAPLQ